MIAMLLALALTADQANAILRAAGRMESQPRWLTSFDEAEAVSVRTGRPLLAFNTLPYCRPCQTFAAWQQVANLDGWVLLRVDVRYSNPLRVGMAPTHVVRVDGREMGRWEGQGNVYTLEAYQRTLDHWKHLASRKGSQ